MRTDVNNISVSVVICTFGRCAALAELMKCLLKQEYHDFEVLIVDGNGKDSPARDVAQKLTPAERSSLRLRVIDSPRGLTRQRNAGLREAQGETIVFLDDDVSVESGFLAKVIEVLAEPGMQDVGGLTGYDVLNYPSPISARWRLRHWLGAIPSLRPGDADHLGRAVPVSFLKPLSGCIDVRWLSGFCMIYRRAAVEGLFFDEMLPTYGGEDRDFSMLVARQWRLSLCGDLRVWHHCTQQGRESDVGRMFQTAFGVGRRFGKYNEGWSDSIVIARSFIGDLLVDILAFIARPSGNSFRIISARTRGFFHGLNSCIGNRPLVSGVRPAQVHGRLLVEICLCTLPASLLVATGRPGIAAKLVVASVFSLLAYHFVMQQRFEFVTLAVACLPMMTLLRGLFMYNSVILALGGGVIFWIMTAQGETMRLWHDVAWRVTFLLLALYWWISYASTGVYSTNVRVFELVLSLACTILLGVRRSYLGTALLGMAISTSAVGFGFLPYGDRLGQAEIEGIELGNPILLGLPAALILLVSLADSGKWLLLEGNRPLRLAISVMAGLWLALSASRGSWLTASVGLLMIFIWNKGGKKPLIISLVVLALGIAALLSTERGSSVASYFNKTVDTDRSFANRTSFRSVQWEVFPTVLGESPLWGWGPGSGVEVAGRFTGRHLGWHSLYLLAGGEAGLIGLGCLALLLVVLIMRGLAHQAATGEMAPLMGTVAYMMIGLSVTGMDSLSGIFLGFGFLAGNVAPRARVYRAKFVSVETSDERVDSLF
jgi:glycosyltransferase involved in cell wall biosynthesis/O-antigen ligase